MSGTQTEDRRPGRNAWSILDKLGAVGAVISAMASPCCFPLFATVAGAFSIGSISFLRGNAPILIQSMAALAFVGQIASFRQHRKIGPLLASGFSIVLLGVTYNVSYHVEFVYVALAGLTIAAGWNTVVRRRARHCCRV